MGKYDSGKIQVDLLSRMDEDSVDYADLSGRPEVGYLSGNTPQVRGTGRPDLDDADCDFGIEEGNIESSRPNWKEDDAFLDENGTENCLQSDLRVASRIRRVCTREDTDGNTFEPLGQIEEHDQDDFDSDFTGRPFPYADAKVTTERVLSQEGTILDEAGTSSKRIQFLRLPEKVPIEPSSGTKFQPSDGNKETGLRVVNAPNLIPEENLEGSAHTMQDGQSHEAPDEDSDQLDISAQDAWRKRGCIIRLGSKEAEELLQMDVAKIGRPMYTHLETSPKQSSPNVPTSQRASLDWAAEDLGPDELSRYVEALEVKETYIDTVLDMEDILFDAEEGPGARILQGGKILSSGGNRPARDGTNSASTSSEPAAISRYLGQPPSNVNEVDWVELVGAFQRQGGASLGDRVVGVKEHTVYRIKVYGGGYDWEIHRRYRDFVILYNQLLQLFTHKGTIHLPTPWEKVTSESRKYFGNTSPDVVEVRSALIQVCLQSLLQAGPPLSAATPLLRFLFPDREVSHSIQTGQQGSGKSSRDGQLGLHALLNDFVYSRHVSPSSDHLTRKAEQDQDDGGHTSLGKSIRLIVQLHKKKSLKQQLQAQHFTCAGCYKHLELAVGFLPELVQNSFWTGLRFCEYSGQIFCSTCHLNETAVIPAWVLERWDFTPRHVSQLAKAYLDSIYDKPMLCVSAVNPYLYARVPVLALLTDMRRNLSKMLACVRCPARARLQAMMGSRRYLLESNDFFALRDLADLSKGAFAVLPGYLQAILRKLSIHVTRECSACRDLGEACGAGELCVDPFDVIYPYQEKGITRCQSCHAPYHTGCFLKCNKRCSRCEGQPYLMLRDSQHNGELSYAHLNVESDPGTNISSSVAVGIEDLSGGSSATLEKKVVKAKRRLLTNFLGSEEIQSSEFQIEQGNSAGVNMSAHLSPLEL